MAFPQTEADRLQAFSTANFPDQLIVQFTQAANDWAALIVWTVAVANDASEDSATIADLKTAAQADRNAIGVDATAASSAASRAEAAASALTPPVLSALYRKDFNPWLAQ